MKSVPEEGREGRGMAVKTGEAARLASHPPVLILLNK